MKTKNIFVLSIVDKIKVIEKNSVKQLAEKFDFIAVYILYVWLYK